MAREMEGWSMKKEKERKSEGDKGRKRECGEEGGRERNVGIERVKVGEREACRRTEREGEGERERKACRRTEREGEGERERERQTCRRRERERAREREIEHYYT